MTLPTLILLTAAPPDGLTLPAGAWSVTDVIGVVGALLYLVGYAAIQLGLLRGDRLAYSLVNLFASGFVLLSLMADFNLSSFIVNAVWFGLSILGLMRVALMARRPKFSDEERAFLAAKLPTLDHHSARALLDRGHWFDAEPGHIFIHESEPAPHLIYLADGAAQISLGGRDIGRVPAGSLFGEITCLSREPATATVTLLTEGRYLSIDAVALRRLVEGSADVRHALQATFMAEAKAKLARMNEAKALLSEAAPS
ncbi:MAG: cyclic nucleotide-binding domain-containing protein [Pseudomonadota bacterium]